MRRFPDWIATYLEYTKGHEATRRVHMWSGISALAGALERKIWIDRGFYTLYPNLYVFIVGRSGLIKKSTSTGIAVDMLRELKGVRTMSERLTAVTLITQLHQAGKIFFHGQERIRESPVFIYASELSVFLSEVYGNILDLLTTFYDCVPHDPSKPWVYESKNSGKVKIYGPCLNILAATTKAWLVKCLPKSEMEGGFTSRVLFVVENNPPERLVAWPEVSAPQRELRAALIEDLRWIYSLTGPMTVTPGAQALFTKWYEYHMRHVVPNLTDARFSGYNGRKGDLMLKLGMIRAVSQRDDLVMTEQDLLWAGEKLEDIEPEMKQAFDSVSLNPISEVAFEVRNYIRRRGLADRLEVHRIFNRSASSAEIDRCLEDLLEMKEIELTEREVEGSKRPYFQPTKIELSDL